MDLIALFGTLRHPPLRMAVLDRDARTRVGLLPERAVRTAAGKDWPILAEGPGAEVEVLEAAPGDLARLDFYEAVFGYRRIRIQLADRTEAWVYAPPVAPGPVGPPWSLAEWAPRHAALTVEAAAETMACFGQDPASVAWRRGSILRRSQARLAGRIAPGTDRRGEIRITNLRREHDYFYALDSMDIDHPTYAGGRTGDLDRSVVLGFDVVLALPWDPVRRRVLLVEQFRLGPYMRGEPDPWCLEPVAGLVDPFEMPETCARREAEEEAGVRPSALHHMSSGYPSTGSSTEYQQSYLAICDLPDDAVRGTGGVEAEGEDIARVLMDEDEAIDAALAGRFRHVGLTMMTLWLAAMRDRVRADV